MVSNQVQFSDFYNCVISLRIAEELSLDLHEPYVDLVLISQDSSFIAKKAKTFEEEKKIAEKAPVDGIKMIQLRACLIELLMKLILKTQLSKHYQKQNIGYY